MSEMIERVARAIHAGVGFHGEYGQSPFSKEQCDRAALAAIEAMREPTNEMVGAGVEGWKVNGYASIQFVWPFMIDAALSVSDEQP
ncbi:hypothetical protein [Microvirga sp. Mcv34]|uniref:hypothetical protein n=1 Tax=Microvirga sp. Mcv34 TaxID=2926016 RepID=UPI0021C812FC|nr:hypothetical protein [Microvirga sp. Mcv34]